jgi:hypothetical protein
MTVRELAVERRLEGLALASSVLVSSEFMIVFVLLVVRDSTSIKVRID